MRGAIHLFARMVNPLVAPVIDIGQIDFGGVMGRVGIVVANISWIGTRMADDVT